VELLGANGATHLCILSRNPHPGPAFAGFELGLQVIHYVEGQSTHSMDHAKHLMKGLFVRKFLAQAKTELKAEGKSDFISEMAGGL